MSVATNAAIDLVKRMEEGIISQPSTMLSRPESYWDAVKKLYVDDIMKSDDHDERLASIKSFQISVFDDFLYMLTGRAASPVFDLLNINVPYPQHILSARLRYVSRPELLDLSNTSRWKTNMSASLKR